MASKAALIDNFLKFLEYFPESIKSNFRMMRLIQDLSIDVMAEANRRERAFIDRAELVDKESLEEHKAGMRRLYSTAQGLADEKYLIAQETLVMVEENSARLKAQTNQLKALLGIQMDSSAGESGEVQQSDIVNENKAAKEPQGLNVGIGSGGAEVLPSSSKELLVANTEVKQSPVFTRRFVGDFKSGLPTKKPRQQIATPKPAPKRITVGPIPSKKAAPVNATPKQRGRPRRRPTKITSEPLVLYCYCKRPYFGTMIGCDGPNCPLEWYHLNCVGLVAAPPGRWFCPEPKCQAAKIEEEGAAAAP